MTDSVASVPSRRFGYAPQIVLNVNTKYGIINTATIFCQKHVAEKARAFPTQLKNVLIDELDAAGVLVALDTGVVNMMGHSSGRKVVMVTSQDDVVEIVLEKNKLEELKEKVVDQSSPQDKPGALGGAGRAGGRPPPPGGAGAGAGGAARGPAWPRRGSRWRGPRRW